MPGKRFWLLMIKKMLEYEFYISKQKEFKDEIGAQFKKPFSQLNKIGSVNWSSKGITDDIFEINRVITSDIEEYETGNNIVCFEIHKAETYVVFTPEEKLLYTIPTKEILIFFNDFKKFLLAKNK